MRRLMRIFHLLLVAIVLLLVSTSNATNPTRGSMPFTREIDRGLIPQQGTQPDFQIQLEPNQRLMKDGTASNSSLVLTSIFGFVGNVALSASISPGGPSAPTPTLPSSVYLNASTSGLLAYFLRIYTTTATPLGLYTITVLGVSGSISHSATIAVGVTDSFIPGNGGEMIYRRAFATSSYAGSSTTLNNTFEDLGYVSIGVWNLTVSLSFGTFRLTGGTFTISPFQETTLPLTFGIPANTSPGNYSLTVTIQWFLGPYTIYQTSGPDLVSHGSMIVYSNAPGPLGSLNLSGLVSLLLSLLGGVVAAAAIMFLLLTVIERRRKDPFRGLSRSSESVQPRSAATKSCPYCGQTVPAGEFCAECGSQLYQPPSPQSPPKGTAEEPP